MFMRHTFHLRPPKLFVGGRCRYYYHYYHHHHHYYYYYYYYYYRPTVWRWTLARKKLPPSSWGIQKHRCIVSGWVEPPLLLMNPSSMTADRKERPCSIVLVQDDVMEREEQDGWNSFFQTHIPTRYGMSYGTISFSSLSSSSSSSSVSSLWLTSLMTSCHEELEQELAHDLATIPNTVLIAHGPFACWLAQGYLESYALLGLVLVNPIPFDHPQLEEMFQQKNHNQQQLHHQQQQSTSATNRNNNQKDIDFDDGASSSPSLSSSSLFSTILANHHHLLHHHHHHPHHPTSSFITSRKLRLEPNVVPMMVFQTIPGPFMEWACQETVKRHSKDDGYDGYHDVTDNEDTKDGPNTILPFYSYCYKDEDMTIVDPSSSSSSSSDSNHSTTRRRMDQILSQICTWIDERVL